MAMASRGSFATARLLSLNIVNG